jgi:hypothetical protein
MENVATCLSLKLITKSSVAQHVVARQPTHVLWKNITLVAHDVKEFCVSALNAPRFFPAIIAPTNVKAATGKSAGKIERSFWR